MLTLDTIKLKIPVEAIKDINLRSLDTTYCTKGEYEYWNIEPIPEHGISTSIYNKRHLVTSFSAKILLDNYPKLISLNTIEEAITKLSKASRIKFDVQKVIDESLVLRCDSTQNLKPSYPIVDCRDALLLANTSPKCVTTIFRKKNNSGVVYNLTTGKEKRRMIFYDKEIEMTKGYASSRKFLESCEDPNKVINAMKGVFRCEVNHTSFKSIRNRFNIKGDILLKKVLSSDVKANYNFMQSATSKLIQLDLFAERYDGMKLCEVEKLFGQLHIAEMFHFDENLIRVFLGKFLKPSSIPNYMTRYREVIGQGKLNKVKKTRPNFTPAKIVKHITELMLKAS